MIPSWWLLFTLQEWGQDIYWKHQVYHPPTHQERHGQVSAGSTLLLLLLKIFKMCWKNNQQNITSQQISGRNYGKKSQRVLVITPKFKVWRLRAPQDPNSKAANLTDPLISTLMIFFLFLELNFICE